MMSGSDDGIRSVFGKIFPSPPKPPSPLASMVVIKVQRSSPVSTSRTIRSETIKAPARSLLSVTSVTLVVASTVPDTGNSL